jgi:hypothetical protein
MVFNVRAFELAGFVVLDRSVAHQAVLLKARLVPLLEPPLISIDMLDYFDGLDTVSHTIATGS